MTPRYPLQINFQKATTQRSVILLPLRPVSLTHDNLQRWKINNSWHVSRRTQRTINQFEDFLVEYPVHLISVAACCSFLCFKYMYTEGLYYNFSKL